MKNFDQCLKIVLQFEGGYVDDPNDPGGETNLGVTKNVWKEWVNRPVEIGEMRQLTPELVAPLYRVKYWDAIKADDLPSGLDLCAFDCAVNQGVNRSIKFLEQSVNDDLSGVMDDDLIEKINSLVPILLIDDFTLKREMHYKMLPTFNIYGKGWMKRLDEVEDMAKQMAYSSKPII